MKALFLIANSLLEAYESYDRKEDIIHTLFDSLEGELGFSSAIMKGESEKRELDLAGHNLHESIKEFNTGNLAKSKEYLARAISNVTTIAARSSKELGL